MGKHAVGVFNGNFRNGAFYERIQQIKADALDPTKAHPRDVKLARLRGYMGDEAFYAWYEANRYVRKIADMEARIAAKLSEYAQDEELIILQNRAAQIEKDLRLAWLPEVAKDELIDELAEIGLRFHRLGLALPGDQNDVKGDILCGAEV